VAKRIEDGEGPVKVWREERKLTAHALEDQAGLDDQTLEAIESERTDPNSRVAGELARALRLKPFQLVRYSRRPKC